MKVAFAQLNYTIGDFEGNSDKIVSTIEKAKNNGADLVIFSELSVTGYYPHDLLEKKEFIQKAEETVLKIAGICNGIAAIVGAPRINESEHGKKLYNSAFFLSEGKIQSIHNKTLLPTYDIFDEYRHFEPNNEFCIVKHKGENIAITICEDLWDEQPSASEFGKDKLYQISPMEELIKFNPDFVVNISASPFSYNQEDWRKNVLISKAKKYKVPVLYINQVGAQTELIFDGGSVFISKTGEILKELKYFYEDFLIVDTKYIGGKQVQNPSGTIEKIHDALVMGIRDYFWKMNFKQATLGLSGGIDSAVTLVLAVRALGAENVRVLLMPSKYSSGHSLEDARQLAENLNVRYDVVNIQNAVDKFENELAPLFKGTSFGVTEENIQARVRGIFVMAISNKFGHILLNTTNKSESAVGYGTLYGDMNGGLAVIGDVYKMDVFKLSRFMNKDGEIIPENSIVKPPSAELRPDQKDTDSLPEYEDLDQILFNYLELNKSPQEIVEIGFNENVVTRVIRMVNMNEYKRFQAAPILRISSKAFGFGRKMPLVAKY
ncbi:MAG: NAD+ synthase [Prolixibacteraceae bacterium]|jgi:NAD+ synthase (glutamine-hydrolysing)|nr:NAD+ synthase [Prolixibacteraceae bacterium]MBT6007195.1 NAD+ synthase [Prolixibacteraceae bacterium]MBT6765800.1 NAD+ synthase [Prolixibacteraceae bacterium]MBT6999701.1 NAD+ synthase [Prolixibacteraceae bacterium]MBT7394080.1 NAD+ synthase [Prolixibacteraceae bacterium]